MTRIATAEDYRRSQWEDLSRDPPARDRWVFRVLHKRDVLSADEFEACCRLWRDLARASGQRDRMAVVVDASRMDAGPSFVDQGAAFRRAAAAMQYVIDRLRTDLQRRVFARAFDTADKRMDFKSVLADCRCDHTTLAKALHRAGDLLFVHYARADLQIALDRGPEKQHLNL
jgi:hypothetical protein